MQGMYVCVSMNECGAGQSHLYIMHSVFVMGKRMMIFSARMWYPLNGLPHTHTHTHTLCIVYGRRLQKCVYLQCVGSQSALSLSLSLSLSL
jgi:hypothetical protein